MIRKGVEVEIRKDNDLRVDYTVEEVLQGTLTVLVTKNGRDIVEDTISRTFPRLGGHRRVVKLVTPPSLVTGRVVPRPERGD